MKKRSSAAAPRSSKSAVRSAARPAGTAPGTPPAVSPDSVARWTFLTNHSHVLIVLSRHPDLVLREVAVHVGITERAVQRIIADLEDAKIIERERIGRKNHYRIMADKPLRHPIEAHRSIADLLSLIDQPG